MALSILFALAASLCTATASVCQRLGAVSLPGPPDGTGHGGSRGFDPLLVFRLARRPVWLLGFVGMLAGFACQLTALRFGPLAVVQPILAIELPFVFGYLAVTSPGRVGRGDWLAALTMAAGVAVFLVAASPSGGRDQAPAAAWLAAGVVTVAAIAAAVAASRLDRGPSGPGAEGGPGGRPETGPVMAGPGEEVAKPPGRPWRAACLGVATGVAWGFVAAVVKELSARLGGGLSVVFTTWPVYVLMTAGAAAMLLTAHAMAAGPLAASQPGFTLLDPLTATILGVSLYREDVGTSPGALAAQAVALVALAAGARALSRGALLDAAAVPAGGEPDTGVKAAGAGH
jgi:drug/metabolite transporter (DMT)-like permease